MGKLTRLLLAMVFAASLSGCPAHVRVNAWGPGETTYYAQWERDTHHPSASIALTRRTPVLSLELAKASV